MESTRGRPGQEGAEGHSAADGMFPEPDRRTEDGQKGPDDEEENGSRKKTAPRFEKETGSHSEVNGARMSRSRLYHPAAGLV